MPMELLKEIASSALPRQFIHPADIDKIRVLRAAGLVVASVSAVRSLSRERPADKVAEVFAVTHKGLQALERGACRKRRRSELDAAAGT